MKPLVHSHPVLKGIFESLFLCTIPQAYLRSEQDIRERGVYTSGDPEVDKAVGAMPARTYMTINDMFEHWRNGVNIGVVKYDDTKKIYDNIEAHLGRWLSIMQQGLHLHTCPFDDLIALDKFANVVYDKAKFVFDDKALMSLDLKFNKLNINLQTGGFFNRGGAVFFNHMFKTETEKLLEAGTDIIRHTGRRGFEDQITEVASRYDFRGVNESRKAIIGTEKDNDLTQHEVKPLSTPLRFGNE